MSLGKNKLRFIPYRKRDLVEMLVSDDDLTVNPDQFRQLYFMLSSIFHFEFHQVVEALKDSYAAVDPDADTRKIDKTISDSDLSFVELLGGLLEKANYEQISQGDLNQALNETSLFKIRLQVDFEEFSEVLLFCRGESIRSETLSSWFGLRKKVVEFINYDRVVVYIRFNDDIEDNKRQLQNYKPGATLLKLFQNVPKADLEMLFPNTRVRMRTIDKLLIGVPALISGGVVLTTKVGASLILLGSLIGFWLGLSSQPVEITKASLMALLAGMGGLGAYLWKQFSKYKNRKLEFMQALTKNLYFKNLDNNAGVFHRLANDAEEEEVKEALLAYAFLTRADKLLTAKELDIEIEAWMKHNWQCEIDFEISDALNKLEALKLVEKINDGYVAIDIDTAIKKLDQRWDDYFIAEE